MPRNRRIPDRLYLVVSRPDEKDPTLLNVQLCGRGVTTTPVTRFGYSNAVKFAELAAAALKSTLGYLPDVEVCC